MARRRNAQSPEPGTGAPRRMARRPAGRRVTTWRALLLAALVAVAASGCSKGSDQDRPPAAARRQAVEKLNRYGLTKDQASCVVDRLGADTVVEAPDLNALAESGPYRSAAKACGAGGS